MIKQSYQRIGDENDKKNLNRIINGSRISTFDISEDGEDEDRFGDEQHQLRRLAGSIARTNVDAIFQRLKLLDDDKRDLDQNSKGQRQQQRVDSEDEDNIMERLTPVKPSNDGLLRDFPVHTSYIHSSEEDGVVMDDDDDDSTNVMSRYSAAANTASDLQQSPKQRNQQQPHSCTEEPMSCRHCVTHYYESYRRMKQESHQKRVQQVMALEDTPEGSLFYVVRKINLLLSSPWLDLTETRGVFAASLVAFGFILTYVYLEQERNDSTSLVAGIGISIFMLRCMWSPVYWCLWGRRAQRVSDAKLLLHFCLFIRNMLYTFPLGLMPLPIPEPTMIRIFARDGKPTWNFMMVLMVMPLILVTPTVMNAT